MENKAFLVGISGLCSRGKPQYKCSKNDEVWGGKEKGITPMTPDVWGSAESGNPMKERVTHLDSDRDKKRDTGKDSAKCT